MIKAPFVCLAAAAALLSGCATGPVKSSASNFTRTYSDSRATVWQRILTTSAGQQMFIRRADAATGVVSADRELPPTEQTSFFEESISNWAWCGSGGVLGHTLSQRVEVNYLVRDERDGRTTVTVNGRFRVLRSMAPLLPAQWVECTSTGVLEDRLIQNLYYDQAT